MAFFWTFGVSGKDGILIVSLLTELCSDLMQTLGCLNDDQSNPQLKRRRKLDIIDPPISQSQQRHHGALWEQTRGPLQMQIAAEKLEPPALMQASCVHMNSWDVNSFSSPLMGDIECQPFMTSQAGNVLNDPTTKSALAGTNLHPSSSQGAHTLHSLDPHLQPPGSSEDPSTMGHDIPDELFAMWSNLPISFSSYDWDAFWSDATQPQSRS
jgi:hypothetical protein